MSTKTKKSSTKKAEPKPKVAQAKTGDEQISVKGFTLADFKKMIGSGLLLDDVFARGMETLFKVCAAAVNEGKGAAMSVAFTAFMPIVEVMSNDLTRWSASVKRRNDAETIEHLCAALFDLNSDEEGEKGLKAKLTARLDGLVDQLFPPPVKLVMETPIAIDTAEFLKREPGVVPKDEPPPETFKVEDGGESLVEPPPKLAGQVIIEELE